MGCGVVRVPALEVKSEATGPALKRVKAGAAHLLAKRPGFRPLWVARRRRGDEEELRLLGRESLVGAVEWRGLGGTEASAVVPFVSLAQRGDVGDPVVYPRQANGGCVFVLMTR